ncbi:hypothetical protein KYC5002_43925 [Archangium violaceum]|uniref:hypothetical protein n=1 Tax=Archangium violaceum TaxID=83451 RepID=UPI002B2F1A86|nr:hypothetical protein KYC5002_43925 [Archangium gephyra]
MKKLRLVGLFREMPHGMPQCPSIREHIAPTAHEFESKIVEYLRSGEVMIASPGLVGDVLGDPQVPVAAPHVFTDGEWAWPGDLAYYVGKYHVRLPAEFVMHMQANGWRVPGGIDLSQLALG